MNTKQRQATAVMSVLCMVSLHAQVLNNASGDYRLTLSGNNPRSFTVGGTFSPLGFMSALTVRGDQMGGTSVTPEVFRTNAPTTGLTYWRMFQGGTTPVFERGQLFADPANSHFNISAPMGSLRLYTSGTERARLNGNLTTSVNGFPLAQRFGYMLLSGQPDAFTNALSRAPFTRLHLVDDTGAPVPNTYAQELGYRPWMRNGVTFTGHSDQGYIGQKYGEADDNTDMVIQWSDNPQTDPWGCDRLKFVFSSVFNGSAKGMGSYDGMEAMRFWPKNSEEVNVGIGDFAPAIVGDPTERLDILNGRVRIRKLPDDLACDRPYKVMVVDNSPAPDSERGVVKWIDLPQLTADCDWTVNPGTNPGDNDVWTADGLETDECPDETEGVGIGLMDPAAKLDVLTSNFATAAQVRNANTGGSPIALRVLTDGGAAAQQGIVVQSTGSTSTALGISGLVSGTGANNTGVGMMVVGGSVTNTGMGAIVNGATGSNIGLSATVNGSPAINVGTDVNVNGTPSTTNIGDRIRVGGASPFNVGANVAVSDGTDDNLGVNVAVTGTGGNRNFGIQIIAAGNTERVRGVVAETHDATKTGYGAHLMEYSTAAEYSHGVAGYSEGGINQSFGVWGKSDAGATTNIGVYGFSGPGGASLPGGRHGLVAGVAANASGDRAGYFDGDVEVTGVGIIPGGVWTSSDAQLKQNVAPYNPSDEQAGLFDQLQVYGYEYIPDALPGASLPEGPQVGFMAQQLAELYPQLTRDVVYPARYDSLGQLVSPAVTYKAIRQEGLIPYMTLEIQQLRQQMNAMAEVMAACCANPDLPRSMAGTTTGAEAVEMERLSIRPNPFPGVTQVQYHLTSEGRVRLEVSSNDGRLVAVLADQRMPAGTHNVEWNASDLPAGTYFVALVVDGGVVVKRAVNLAAR